MPPPETPSPRRTKLHDTSTLRKTKPPSSLRRTYDAETSSSQFAPTPRFNISSSKGPSRTPQSSTSPLATRGRQPAGVAKDEIHDNDEAVPRRTSGYLEHDIIEDDDYDQEDDMLLDTIEGEITAKRRHPSTSPPEAPPTVRRKADPEAIVVSSSPSAESDPNASSDDEPDTPAAPKMSKQPEKVDAPSTSEMNPPRTPASKQSIPRFRFGPAAPLGTSQAGTDAEPDSSRHPHFVLPSQPDASSMSDGLPTLFSPQKRGDRFKPGGLADRLRNVILHAGAQMQVAATQEILVHAARRLGNGGAMLLDGRVAGSDEEHSRIILVGAGELDVRQVRRGETIKARFGWDVHLPPLDSQKPEETPRERHLVYWGPL